MKEKKSIIILLTICLNCVCIITLFAQDNKINTILNKVFNAVGGRTQWESVKTRIDYYEDTHANDMLNVNSPFSHLKYSNGIKLYKKLDDNVHCDKFILISKTNVADTFSTCFNGDKYWSQSTNSKPIVYDSYANRYSKFVNCGYPSWLLRSDSITYSDSLSLSDELHEVLEVHITGTTLILYFNHKNFLLEKYCRKDKSSTITYLKDYRIVQNKNIPFVQETYQNGSLATSVKLQEVKFNIELDNTFFKFPENSPYPIIFNNSQL